MVQSIREERLVKPRHLHLAFIRRQPRGDEMHPFPCASRGYGFEFPMDARTL